MKSNFYGYYMPSSEWFSKLWSDCVFIVDANVLLNFYRYSNTTSNQLFSILESLQDRLWIPHQAALEYHQRRLEVISGETKNYSETLKHSKALIDNLTSSRRHPFASDSLVERVIVLLNKLENDLIETQDKREKLLTNDPLQERIGNLFENKVGEPFSIEQLVSLESDGEKRFRDKIPPGYKDTNKEGNRKYGDLLVWSQILLWVQQTPRDIIFITDDAKEDWWLIHSGKIIGPRPELLEEITQLVNIKFYMYQPGSFMEHARKYLHQKIINEAIAETRSLSDTQLSKNVVEQDTYNYRISGKYKAIKRFIEKYDDIKSILNIFSRHNISVYDTSSDPESIPDSLINELKTIIQEDSGVVVAIQAVHSLSSAILEDHVRRTKLSGEMCDDVFAVNMLPGTFIRLLDVMRDHFHVRDQRSELKKYLQEKNCQDLDAVGNTGTKKDT